MVNSVAEKFLVVSITYSRVCSTIISAFCSHSCQVIRVLHLYGRVRHPYLLTRGGNEDTFTR